MTIKRRGRGGTTGHRCPFLRFVNVHLYGIRIMKNEKGRIRRKEWVKKGAREISRGVIQNWRIFFFQARG